MPLRSPQDQMRLQQALALHQAGRLDEALALYRPLLSAHPADAELLRLAGTALAQAGRFDDGAGLLRQSLAVEVNPDTWHCLGNALQGLGQFEAAIDSYNHVLSLKPDDPDALNARGNAWQDLKQFDKAFADYDRALSLAPGHLDAMLNQGIALRALDRPKAAQAAFDRLLALDPNDAEALNQRADLRFLSGDVPGAVSDYRRAVRLKPGIDGLPGHALYVQMYLADWTGLAEGRNWLARHVHEGRRVTAPLPLHALLDDPAIHLRAAQNYAPKATHPPLPPWPRRDRIRIGYVSSDFKNHPVSHLLAGVLEWHDRARFEIFAFSLRHQADDAWRTRIRTAADHFVQLADFSDTDAIGAMREHQIDIAIDLNGYTHGGRTELFAGRVAPVQASYLGFLGTMGNTYIEYLLADAVIVPPADEAFYSETIVRLPSFQVNDDRQSPSGKTFTRAGQGLPPDGFVFCSFNQAYKLTPEVFGGWMRILVQVPGSVLWLLVKEPLALANLRAEAERRGIDPARIVPADMLPLEDHLARLPLADLFLDSHPYNAGATASNALRMGVPVLTRIGRSFAARMGASLLTAAGLPELIAETPEAYEALAVRLATAPDALAEVKRKLAIHAPASALFDTERGARALEDAFRWMYEQGRLD